MVAVAQAVLLALFFMSGCRSSYVGTQETTRHHVVDSTSGRNFEGLLKHDSVMKRDSIWLHDSVFVKQVGDTIFHDRWHTKEVYKYLDRGKDVYHYKHDTLYKYVATNDTVYKDKKVEVEKKLTVWQYIKQECGEFWFVGLIFSVLLLIARKKEC